MNQGKKEISQKVQKILEIIETKEHSKNELINFFNNAINYPDINDFERETIVEAVEKKMRIKFPKAAKKILGGKSAKTQELLEEAFNALKKEFDWSKNCVGSRVKVSGRMISGKEYIGWYISYKNDEGYSSGFGYRQKKADDDPYLEIDYRKVGKEHKKNIEVKIFPVELKKDALNLYRSFLSKVIC